MPHTRRQSGFTLIELLMVVAIIGIVASVALPGYQRIRLTAVETQVVGDLNGMFKGQQMFYLNPIPVEPSALVVDEKRYARLHELNGFTKGSFGQTTATFYIVKGQVTYSMSPLWPSTKSLTGRFTIEGRGTGDYTFIYSVDESGKVAKIR